MADAFSSLHLELAIFHRIDAHTPLRWVDEFTYLGVGVGDVGAGYLERLTQRWTMWRTFPLTPVCRGNLL